jgi:hypothetical protein
MSVNAAVWGRVPKSLADGLALVSDLAADSANAETIDFILQAIGDGQEYQARHLSTGGKLTPAELGVPQLPEL